MIRLVGRYQVAAGTFEDFAPVVERMMGALLSDDSIIDPDLALDLEAKSFEVHMLIDGDDPWDASQIGSSAMLKAFRAANIDVPDRNRVLVHTDLLKRTPVSVETSLVAAVG